MNCYEEHPEAEAAVAVCRICGKGVCRNHAVELIRCIYEHVSSGMAAGLRLTNRRLSMMVCSKCAAVLGDDEVDEKVVVTSACCPPKSNKHQAQ